PPKKDLYHRWIYQRLNAVITSSSWVQSEIQNNFPIEPSRARRIRYGRPSLQKSSPVEVLKVKNNLDSDLRKIIFGTACRIDPGKGIKELALALEKIQPELLDKMELWIIGEPTLLKTHPDGTPEYEPKSDELNHWLIEFQKKYPKTLKLIPFQKNLQLYLSAMDVFILASHGETYSLAVIDAMMLGLPVIGTNSGGTPEQITGGNPGLDNSRGLLVEPHSPLSLAQAIEKLILSPELRKSFSIAAEEWSQREHSWEKTIKHMMDLYHEN
ncbi:MAG TPA: glycosyltransferase family 4 protein, partial [Pseudobdellovibrionaceae bacterium]|nr:glycosyltransferase family 4 protein [Pseudobdellovibrionaceae bacterium]